MATGRDAADVALTTFFGPSAIRQFVVWTDDVSQDLRNKDFQEAGSTSIQYGAAK